MQKKLLLTFKISLLIGFVAVCAGLPSQTRAMIAELEQEAANYRTRIACRNCAVYCVVQGSKTDDSGNLSFRTAKTEYKYEVKHWNGLQGEHKEASCRTVRDNEEDFKKLDNIMLAVKGMKK